MRALLQRVARASVSMDGEVVGAIAQGLCILLGVGPNDNHDVARQLAHKAAELRIFNDDAGKMNRSLLDVHGGALVVSQFTLYADTSHGRRPGFTGAAPPASAAPLVAVFAEALGQLGVEVQTGRFGADMLVEIL
ncbi:MAG TPA: D-aminoacyl-tRNA deacylase, partial [Chloroflexota bacterium]|nr:D-aminoacyl-tRNA deacylase [Chloroflexota bacterium]